ncbi:hypothetical protein Tco_1237775 [Tanacetum coccineum]
MKPKTTKPSMEWKSEKKSKSTPKSQPRIVKVKAEADIEEILNGPTRGMMVVEEVEWKMKKKRLNHWVKGVEDYQLNDMVVDDSVRVDANQDVNHMEVDLSIMVEESQAIVVEESVMVKESYDDVASTDRLDDDNYDATYLTVNVPDSMFDENDIDVTDNQDFDSDFGKESDLERIRISKLSQLRKRKLQEDSVMNKHDLFIGQSFGSSTHIKDRVYMHSIETRRKLKLIRNGKRRVRAKCVGQMPIFDLNDNGLCKDGPSNQSASHSKGLLGF